MNDFEITPEQKAVVDYREPGLCKVIAYAGAGKTSTLRLYAEARPVSKILYAAFNKSISEAAKSVFPGNVDCRTVHSIAYQHVGRKFPKIGNLSYFALSKSFGVSLDAAIIIMETLNNWLNSAEPEITRDCCPFYHEDKEAEAKAVKQIIHTAKSTFERMQDGRLEMTHSGYLKLFQLSKKKLAFDTILLDEAQDVNPVILDIVQNQAQHAKIVLVGDPFQQIYAFIGSVDAMDLMQGEVRYLSQSFRFGETLAAKATEFLSQFYDMNVPLRGLPHASTEIVDKLPPQPYTHIFRGNSSLFSTAVQLAQAKTPICLTGGMRFHDFLDEVLDLYQVYVNEPEKCKSGLFKALKKWATVKTFAMARNDSQLQGKIDIVERHTRGLPGVIDMVRNADVGEYNAKVLLVTAHRAKGLQWDNVVMADDYSIMTDDLGSPLPVTKSATIKRSKGEAPVEVPCNEVNLAYVAMTRAMKKLKIGAPVLDLLSSKRDRRLIKHDQEYSRGGYDGGYGNSYNQS